MRVMAGTTFPQSSDSPPFAKGGQGGFSNLSLTKPAINPPPSPFFKGGSHGAPLPRQINPSRTPT